MEVTTARILDKRRMLKKTKTYPLAIRVTFNRKPRPFPIDLDLSEVDWKKLSSPRLGDKLKQINEKHIQEEQRAKKIIEKLGTFTFHAFSEEFYKDCTFRKNKKVKEPSGNSKEAELIVPINSTVTSSPSEGKNKKYGKRKFDRIRSNVNYDILGPLAGAFGEYIKLLETQKRIGTSESYFNTLSSLLQFRKQLRLEDISTEFLYEYEGWMLAKNNSLTTVGIYLRNLRAIINLPKNKKLFSGEDYPFGRGKYQIPTGVNVKKALELSEIKKLYDYHPLTDQENEIFSRDIWFFGYFASGINPKDIANLKNKHFDEDDFIVIQREKTRYTTRSKPKKLVIPINEDMRRIREQWGTSDKDPEAYVFPVLSPGLSAHRSRELIHGFIRLINDWMKVIAENVGIKKKVRTMEYRHSMATQLKRSGVSTEFIMETLGHTDLKTTENYLDSFELDVKRKYANHLLAFKDIEAA